MFIYGFVFICLVRGNSLWVMGFIVLSCMGVLGVLWCVSFVLVVRWMLCVIGVSI